VEAADAILVEVFILVTHFQKTEISAELELESLFAYAERQGLFTETGNAPH
jgi:hypothetical protein